MNFKETVDSRYGPGTRQKIRKLEKLKIKLAKETNHVTYLFKCKKDNLIPKGLCLKTPYYSYRATNIINMANKKLLQDRLNFHLSNKQKFKTEIENQTETLSQLIGPDFVAILTRLNKVAEKQNSVSKSVHIKKLNYLKDKHLKDTDKLDPPAPTRESPQTDQTVVNLSSRPLNIYESQVLSKGLNFAVVPKNINTLDFITGIESAVPQLPEELADQFRCEASLALKNIKPVKNNTSKGERDAIKSLKTDDSLKILPSDKGNATVVLNKTDYNSKIDQVLKAGKYTLLKKDPTKSYESKIERTLRKHKEHFTEQTRKKLTPHHSKTPHMYGLPKIHKENVPLRPIVSSKNSPNRELCRFLLPILKPLAGHTETHVTNTPHFVELTKNMNTTEDDILVSFDVESLFTNIPVKETLNIIENRLRNDTELKDRTKIPVEIIMELLNLCTELNYFELNGQIYRQDEGMAMGSPLSPIFANIYMEEFEQKAIATAAFKPKVLLRYVDDTFAIWSHGHDELDKFSNHLNSISPNIKLTVEKEKDGKLAFLDVNVIRENGGLKTIVYRKKTHTGRYLNYKSNHCESIKEGVALSLFDRAKTVCKDETSLKHEFKQITSDLLKNGYPLKVINKCRKPRNKNKQDTQNEKPRAFINIPYVPKISEKIRRIARKYKIQTAFRTQNTLRQHLSKTKPPDSIQASKNVVYSIPCECDRDYIGETKRPLEVRIKEHKNNTQKGETAKSKLAKHAWENEHRFKWKEAKILHTESHYYKRKFIEAALIKLNKEPISQSSIEIRPLWLPFIKNHFNNKNDPQKMSVHTVKAPERTHPMTLRHKRP